jgi:hypothetical protein
MEITLRVKVAFFRLFLRLVGNCGAFFESSPPPGATTAREVFRLEEYLSWFGGSQQDFLAAFAKTQHFTTFIEEAFRERQHLRRPTGELAYFFKGLELLHRQGEAALTAQLDRNCQELMTQYHRVFF